MKIDTFFLHGLDSSGSGTKGSFFLKKFPQVVRPNFSGTLAARLEQFEKICQQSKLMILIGSSFGGLMATCYALNRPQSVARLILLAPALNYDNFRPPATRLSIPTLIVIGKHDTVTPPDLIVPLAEATFSNLHIRIEDDDHTLHHSFTALDWESMLVST